ncbi:UNVERIFIED_ORG: tRNA 2-thiouridine synthesizing protein A [Martelella mediterranea]
MNPAGHAFETYDLRGLKCPLPALKAEKRLAALAPGALLAVETSDPLAVIDIPHLCNERGHRLISTEETDAGHRFIIARG